MRDLLRAGFRDACLGFIFCLVCLGQGHAQVVEQNYPSKVITLIVPFGPGGPPDIVARVAANYLKTALGQPIIIENRTGASGVRAGDGVAKANPDGHTLLLASSSFWALSNLLVKDLPFDPIKDFAPVAGLATIDTYLSVMNDIRGESFKEILNSLRAQPGGFHYGSPGVGSIPHLQFEYIKSAFGFEASHVPYYGVGNIVPQRMIGGEVALAFLPATHALMVDSSGKGRTVAIAKSFRSKLMPGVPTFAEMGFSEVDLPATYGILAPAATPRAVLAKLEDAFVKAASLPEFAEGIRGSGSEVAPSTSDQLAMRIRLDAALYKKAADAAGLRPQ